MVTEQRSERPAETPAGPDRNESLSAPSGLAGRFDAVVVAIDRWRDRPLLGVVLGLAALAIVVAGWWFGRPAGIAPVEAGIPVVATTTASLASPVNGDDEPLVIHVAGEVVRPGIVSLEPGSRVVDAVEAAGGPTLDADLHQLNLAAQVPDGAQVRVPAVGEVISSPFGIAAGGDGSGVPVSINQASAAQLEELPGIGPALATAIVEWREDHGSFASVDDLLQVPGIGPAKLEGLADSATL